jgi:hypothetical protein
METPEEPDPDQTSIWEQPDTEEHDSLSDAGEPDERSPEEIDEITQGMGPGNG